MTSWTELDRGQAAVFLFPDASYFSNRVLGQIPMHKNGNDPRSFRIIGAAMEVHRELGSGFLEAVYQEALKWEFESQGIPNESQPLVKVYFKGNPLNKTYQPDFVCFNEVIVEIKALNQLAPQDHAQIIT